MSISNSLGLEWAVLQKNFERYEMGGLVIKLAGLTLAVIGITLGLNTAFVILLLLVMWVQEGIYRTFQARIGQRILRVEELIVRAGATDGLSSPAAGANMPFQLHSDWRAGRGGVKGLLVEYSASACKPTVAYPYALLVVVVMTNGWLA